MRRFIAALAVALCAAACGGDSSSIASPSTDTAPTTETFASTLYKGRAWRRFTVATAGMVNVTLTAVGPPSVPVGLGLGIPGAGSTCILSISVTTEGRSFPQISEHADPGDYCAEVHDVGNVIDSVNFSITIEHP